MIPSSQKIFIIYEFGHLDEAETLAKEGVTIICFDFLLERECNKRDIPFISLRNFVDAETGEGEWWKLSHDIAREWYRLPAMQFFEYKGIPIAEAPEPILQEYLARLFYYIRIYLAIKKTRKDAELHIPTPKINTSPNASCFAVFMPWAIIDAAHMAGFKTTVSQKRIVENSYSFPKTTWKLVALYVFNAIVSLVPRRGLRVYSSEYWGHLAPVVPFMKDTELMLVESRNFYKIPWRQILKHRIRIFGIGDTIRHAEKSEVSRISAKFIEAWNVAKKDIATYLSSVSKELDWAPVLEACEYLVTYAPRIVADIRSLHRVMKKEKPNVVLQMASVGGPQHYFFLMARVAKMLKIPSIELQHAGATIDPRSIYCRIETDYLATYGDDVNMWHKRIGQQQNKFISVGSPRFDRYTNERDWGVIKGKQLLKDFGLDPKRPVLCVVVPFFDTLATALDSYELTEFFQTVCKAWNNIKGLQILFKFRSYRHIGGMKAYLQELFKEGIAIAGDEDLFALLCASDAVVCNNSTSIYQAVLARKPLILYAWKVFDTYHGDLYKRAAPLLYTENEFIHTLTRIFSHEAYRKELLERQKEFLKGYSFDGKSSRRVAEIIKKIAGKET